MAIFLVLANIGKHTGAATSEPIPIEQVLEPGQVCAIADVMAIDIGSNGEYRQLNFNAVVALGTPSGMVWRGLHLNVDAAAMAEREEGRASHDVMDVARDTLRPLSSEHLRGGRRTAFDFDYAAQIAVLRAVGDAAAETIPLGNAFVVPEGPGDPILTQAIPWAAGLQLRAHVLDRWRGHAAERVRPVVISVEGETTFMVAGKVYPVWIVHTIPDDGSFSVERWITKDQPHRDLRVFYRSSPGAPARISEVLSIANGDDCA